MTHQPEHTCFHSCAGCAFELGAQMEREKKSTRPAKYVWMVVGSKNPCDIRRYAFSHQEGVDQLAHARKSKYKDSYSGGVWTLFKLVRVAKRIRPHSPNTTQD